MKKTILLSLIIPLLISCQKNDEDVPSNEETAYYSPYGYGQKGPFLLGSEVTLIELNNELNPTGKTFFTTTLSDLGDFRFNQLPIKNNIVELKISGKSFNEIHGGVTLGDEIILYAFEDLTDNEVTNINLITHFQHARIPVLMSKGKNFIEAKNQAKIEFLKTFFIDTSTVSANDFDLTSSQIDGAILLTISAIIVAKKNYSTLTLQEYISKLVIDFTSDGVINNVDLTKSLANSAQTLNYTNVIQNIQKRYSDNSVNVNFNKSEELLNNFKAQTTVKTLEEQVFPMSYNSKINLLSPENKDIQIDTTKEYVLAWASSDEHTISSISIFLTSINQENITNSFKDWSVDNNSLKYGFSDTDPEITISFSGRGGLEIQTDILTKDAPGPPTTRISTFSW